MSRIPQILSILFCAIPLLATAIAVKADSARPETTPSNARGLLFSGGLGDPLPMNGKNPQMALWISGKEAENIFKQLEKQKTSKNKLNSDPLKECIDTADGPTQVLSRGNGAVRCELSRHGEYSCALGVDLGRGQSKLGLIC